MGSFAYAQDDNFVRLLRPLRLRSGLLAMTDEVELVTTKSGFQKKQMYFY